VDIVAPAVERYMNELAAYDDEPVLQEMELLAGGRGFPIIGRLCGQTLEVVARLGGARRIFELGSGFGYSAYWFSRAVGPDGEVHLTDSDPDNERKARDFLGRAGLDGPIHYHVGDALQALAQTNGDFDIVYCDIDKEGYPDAWRAGRERVRVGGLFISDNMLWSGRISEPRETHAATTRAIDETNHAIAADPDWRSTMIPTRDGVVVALRLR
jgi:caffeoyl-CoA O-methyltransferase